MASRLLRHRKILIPVAAGSVIAAWFVGERLWKSYDDYQHYYDYTVVNMASIAQAIRQYEIRNKRLPNNLEELTRFSTEQPALLEEGQLQDPWSTPYAYRPAAGGRFEIRSAGKDEQYDTWDDYTLKQ